MHHMITSWLSDFKLDEKGVLAEHWLGLAPWELPALEARVEKGTSTPCLSAEGALQGGLTNFPSATSGKRWDRVKASWSAACWGEHPPVQVNLSGG